MCGDNNLNYLQQNEKRFLTEFVLNNGLEMVNKSQPTLTNGNSEILIDHCIATKNQIFDTITLEDLFGDDHFSV